MHSGSLGRLGTWNCEDVCSAQPNGVGLILAQNGLEGQAVVVIPYIQVFCVRCGIWLVPKDHVAVEKAHVGLPMYCK